ncbi:MAG: glutamate-1-semialdehyde 2,1-aminomutase [Candidatus Omnitrophica bacterium]|nr:glutamate-1-semialdehyde 2,1-aminomutase [Candidatus Omnitrophota bacterium]
MAVLNLAKNLLIEAKKYIPGGINSPVRSFKAVGGYPIFFNKAVGSKFYGECGREFIDYCLSWGALILGHAYPKVIDSLEKAIKKGTSFGAPTILETELAKLIVEAVPSIEQVRLTNSGTEAVMSAVRLARAYTGKNKIIKFDGSYHGHADYLLVKGGSGQATLGIPDTKGVPRDFTKHTIVAPFNDMKKLKAAVKEHQKDLAAIIVEPVEANYGVILPKQGFLESLRQLADKYNIVLIFDEVITGFRLSYGGAQGYFNVTPDLTCLGKIIGGGLPIGAFGGKREIMRLLAPEGDVYQAGTLSGNPIAVTAGITTLKELKKMNPYEVLQKKTQELCDGIRLNAQKYGVDVKINHIASMFSLSSNLFKKVYHGLLKEGVYLSPSEFESNFLSTVHARDDIEKTLKAVDKVFSALGGSASG